MQVVGSGGRIQLLKFSLHRNQEPSKQNQLCQQTETILTKANILIMVNRIFLNQSKTNILIMVNRQK